MNKLFAFVAYENFIGVYRHSLPNIFIESNSSALLYSSFLVEGIQDVSTF